MSLWALIVWIVIGGIAGWVASLIVNGTGLGLLWDIVVGIIGGLIGGWLLSLIGLGGGGIFWTFVTAVIGAVILLLIVKAVMGGRAGMRTRV
jgi:uncharacterized membrane protein YeaQ/YmgE (transglycosylase-associated protein family)